MPTRSASDHEIDEQRPNGTGHTYALQRATSGRIASAQGDGEQNQEHGAQRVCQHENRRQRDQRDPCCEPERALRDGDGEAAWWDVAGCGSDGH